MLGKSILTEMTEHYKNKDMKWYSVSNTNLKVINKQNIYEFVLNNKIVLYETSGNDMSIFQSFEDIHFRDKKFPNVAMVNMLNKLMFYVDF